MTGTYVSSAETDARRTSRRSSLRIVLAGGEGHLGRILARHFSGGGHNVTTLTRRPAVSFTSTCTSSRKSISWDGRNLGAWADELDGTDVVINLSGRNVDCRYNEANRLEIIKSRVDSTRIIGEAIRRSSRPAQLWLNASTATIYRHSYGRAMDEATGEIGGSELGVPDSWRFSIEVALAWEEAFFGAHTPSTRKVAMRAAMVMSTEEAGIFAMLVRLARLGLGGSWGSGKQWMSWIHERDFCRAVDFLTERTGIEGPVNLAAPAPLPNREFLAALRSAMGIPFGLASREWMLAIGTFILRTETELLLKSRRVVPGILQERGFHFLFPEWLEAARDLLRIRAQRKHPAHEGEA
jgi:uncharacterized protein